MNRWRGLLRFLGVLGGAAGGDFWSIQMELAPFRATGCQRPGGVMSKGFLDKESNDFLDGMSKGILDIPSSGKAEWFSL
ncbi:Uncharacterised protein [Corynebacterium imitans]|uniref:Uncharacterized protein n=2 Tax=Corynebacterium imitans TaxID=156978 RepID=A0A239YAH8_9CORY|nr:Uncharacterised protein [Corynebacterium imitans]